FAERENHEVCRTASESGSASAPLLYLFSLGLAHGRAGKGRPAGHTGTDANSNEAVFPPRQDRGVKSSGTGVSGLFDPFSGRRCPGCEDEDQSADRVLQSGNLSPARS